MAELVYMWSFLRAFPGFDEDGFKKMNAHQQDWLMAFEAEL